MSSAADSSPSSSPSSSHVRVLLLGTSPGEVRSRESGQSVPSKKIPEGGCSHLSSAASCYNFTNAARLWARALG